MVVTAELIKLQFLEAKTTRLESDIFSEWANIKLHPICKDQDTSYIPVVAAASEFT